MWTIWKYEITPEEMDLPLTEGATILSVQVQNGKPMMWVHLNPKAAKQIARIRVYGTGHELPRWPGTHVGMFQIGCLVFHVFHANDGALEA